jgi:hypothetical protein
MTTVRATTVMLAVALLGAVAGAGCVPRASGAAPGGGGDRSPAGRTVLVELFTSQGCSSCPAADAFVRDFPRLGLGRHQVVPLTFHVDYWDDLGWKDPFAARAFTDRQRHYAELGRLRSPEGEDGLQGIYTPQMIVDGAVHFSGRRRDVALKEIRTAAAAPALVDLDGQAVLRGNQAQVTVRLAARVADAFRQPWRLFVVLAARSARTHVTRGENSGDTLEEAAVVRSLSEPVRIASAPTEPITITVTKPADLPWSALELDAILASESTWQVGAVRAIELPTP